MSNNNDQAWDGFGDVIEGSGGIFNESDGLKAYDSVRHQTTPEGLLVECHCASCGRARHACPAGVETTSSARSCRLARLMPTSTQPVAAAFSRRTSKCRSASTVARWRNGSEGSEGDGALRPGRGGGEHHRPAPPRR